MVSEVSICNMALTRLGQSVIASFDQRGIEAALCKMYYEPTLKELLFMQNWTFATEKVQLGESGDQNLTPFAYMYNLPSDFIKMVSIIDSATYDDTTDYWKIEGQKILTDISPLYIKYIKYVTTPQVFPQLFIDALYLRIATKMCLKLTQDQNLLGLLFQEYTSAMTTAMGVDNSNSRRTPLNPTLWSK